MGRFAWPDLQISQISNCLFEKHSEDFEMCGGIQSGKKPDSVVPRHLMAKSSQACYDRVVFLLLVCCFSTFAAAPALPPTNFFKETPGGPMTSDGTTLDFRAERSGPSAMRGDGTAVSTLLFFDDEPLYSRERVLRRLGSPKRIGAYHEREGNCAWAYPTVFRIADGSWRMIYQAGVRK